jgi:hypothetical protein
MRHLVVAALASSVFLVALAGCQFLLQGNVQGITPSPTPQAAGAVQTSPDRFKVYIRGKATSNLSADRKTITLSVEVPDDVTVEWTQDKPFGNFNTNKGKDVQWSVGREGTFTVIVTATVTGSKGSEPDLAYLVLPVVDGKIQPAELPPELTVAPQSIVLFRPLPSSLSQSSDTLAEMGVKTKAQLTATSYKYDKTSNTKVKESGDFKETVWTSGDPTIVTVDDNGLVRPADGSDVGSTIVSVASKTNSSSRAGSLVSVAYLDTAITLSYPTTTIYLDGKGTPNSVTLGATIKYSNPLDRDRVIFTDPNGRNVCGFRPKSNGESAPKRTVNPEQSERRFRPEPERFSA